MWASISMRNIYSDSWPVTITCNRSFPEPATIQECDTKEKIERLDLRHRIPFTFPHYENVMDIEQEISTLSIEDQIVFGRLKLFLITYFKSLLEPDDLKIVNFLDGTNSLEEIGLTRENSPNFLRLVKLFDLAFALQTRISRSRILFKHSTYAIRTRILELCSPEMQTIEAYTFTLDPKKLKNVDYLKNPANWVPERIGFYSKQVLPVEFTQLRALSERLKQKKPTVYAFRGNTASGKSTLIESLFKEAVDENGKVSGTVNPDNIKFILKTKTLVNRVLTNMQVHEEAVRGPLGQYKKAVLAMPKYSIVVDSRLSTPEDIEGVMTAAKKRKSKVWLTDVDSNVSTSLIRVLTRDPKGVSPCVCPQAVVKGYNEIRQRLWLIEKVKESSLIERYSLFCTDAKGDVHLAAKKVDNVFEVVIGQLFNTSCQTLKEEELKAEIDQKITTALVDQSISKGLIPKSASKQILRWEGFTIFQAVEKHATANF